MIAVLHPFFFLGKELFFFCFSVVDVATRPNYWENIFILQKWAKNILVVEKPRSKKQLKYSLFLFYNFIIYICNMK